MKNSNQLYLFFLSIFFFQSLLSCNKIVKFQAQKTLFTNEQEAVGDTQSLEENQISPQKMEEKKPKRLLSSENTESQVVEPPLVGTKPEDNGGREQEFLNFETEEKQDNEDNDEENNLETLGILNTIELNTDTKKYNQLTKIKSDNPDENAYKELQNSIKKLILENKGGIEFLNNKNFVLELFKRRKRIEYAKKHNYFPKLDDFVYKICCCSNILNEVFQNDEHSDYFNCARDKALEVIYNNFLIYACSLAQILFLTKFIFPEYKNLISYVSLSLSVIPILLKVRHKLFPSVHIETNTVATKDFNCCSVPMILNICSKENCCKNKNNKKTNCCPKLIGLKKTENHQSLNVELVADSSDHSDDNDKNQIELNLSQVKNGDTSNPKSEKNNGVKIQEVTKQTNEQLL